MGQDRQVSVEMRLKDAVTKSLVRMKAMFKRTGYVGRAAFWTLSASVAVFKKAMSATLNVLKRMRTALTRWARRAALAFAALTVAAVKFATDFKESENLFIVSMGRMEKKTREWSERFAKAFYLAPSRVRKYVGTLNVMLKSMGMTTDEAAEMSTTLSALAFDMASFYNLRLDEAFQKIKSGLVGMPRPLQDIGIILQENVIKQRALQLGLIQEGQDLDFVNKVRMRYKVLLEQTTTAQGDMKRTLNEGANVFRAIKDQVIVTAESFGKGLLPVVEKFGLKLRNWLQDNQDRFERWGKIIGEKLDFVATKMGDFFGSDKTWAEKWSEMWDKMVKIAELSFFAIADLSIEAGKYIGENLGKSATAGIMKTLASLPGKITPHGRMTEAYNKKLGKNDHNAEYWDRWGQPSQLGTSENMKKILSRYSKSVSKVTGFGDWKSQQRPEKKSLDLYGKMRGFVNDIASKYQEMSKSLVQQYQTRMKILEISKEEARKYSEMNAIEKARVQNWMKRLSNMNASQYAGLDEETKKEIGSFGPLSRMSDEFVNTEYNNMLDQVKPRSEREAEAKEIVQQTVRIEFKGLAEQLFRSLMPGNLKAADTARKAAG